MSKITQLTIITQQGTNAYFVGRSYNGLFLHRIVDNSLEGEGVFCSIYQGETKEGELVFEAINAPLDVTYSVAE